MAASPLQVGLRRFAVPGFLLGIATFLPGCIGFGYSTTECTVGAPPDRGTATADDLLRRWGEPDERTSEEDGTESWVYDRGPRVAFVSLCVVVCLPLGIVAGRESDTFHLRDGAVESVDSVRGVEVWHLCGYILGVCPDFGCRSIAR